MSGFDVWIPCAPSVPSSNRLLLWRVATRFFYFSQRTFTVCKWMGGFIGAFFVVSTISLAPRLGAATMVAGVLAGQMLASLILDHFGFIGYTIHPINGMRLLGVLWLTGVSS